MAKTSKAEDIYALIKAQILSGRWKPGDRINDKELADEMQVSRISVREALFKLTETGIIEKEYWKGYYIKQITQDIVANMIEIRIALESVAITHFTTEATEKDIADLENVLIKCKSDLNENDDLNYLTTDYSFHEIIYSRQHNNYITATMNNYQLPIHFIRYASMGKDANFTQTATNSINWHTRILEAIKERNPENAAKLMVAHLSDHKNEAYAEIKAQNTVIK